MGAASALSSGELKGRSTLKAAGLVPYVRTVKTTSGVTAVQVVWSSRSGSRDIGHLGSAHDEAGVEALKAGAAAHSGRATGARPRAGRRQGERAGMVSIPASRASRSPAASRQARLAFSLGWPEPVPACADVWCSASS